jgi:hypothetical protein
MVSKARIFVSVLVIAIIGILVIPMESDNSEPITTVYESDIVSSDDINMDQIIIDQAIQEYSIIETNRVFTESDQSLIDQFLDESGLPSSSEKLGIEVQTVLFDSDQKQYPTSNIIGIPELSVTDEQGRVLDLGTIQTSFLAISAKTEQQFNLDGTVKFYLDDDLIATKKIYGSDSNKQNHELSLLDSLPPTSFDRPKAFTFTLSDEGRDWEDKSEHTYRVVLTEVNANLDSNKDFKQFSWNGENIVYELKVTVDDQKKVVLDENNSAIQIFKNDSTIQICGMSAKAEIPYKGWTKWVTDNPRVTVDVGKKGDLETIIDFDYESTGAGFICNSKHCFSNLQATDSCSAKVDGIPRSSIVYVNLDYDDNSKDIEYTILTPTTQKNYYISEKLISSSYNIYAQHHPEKIVGKGYSVSISSTPDTNLIDDIYP